MLNQDLRAALQRWWLSVLAFYRVVALVAAPPLQSVRRHPIISSFTVAATLLLLLRRWARKKRELQKMNRRRRRLRASSRVVGPKHFLQKRSQRQPQPSAFRSHRSQPSDKETRQRLAFLAQTKFVSCLGPDRFFQLLPYTLMMVVHEGEVIFSPTKLLHAEWGLIIVVKGQLGLYYEEKLMCELGPGKSVGESGLISKDPPKVSVLCRARARTELYYLSRSQYAAFTAAHPDALVDFLRTVIAREWRVASYVLNSYLKMPQLCRESMQGAPDDALLSLDLDAINDADTTKIPFEGLREVLRLKHPAPPEKCASQPSTLAETNGSVGPSSRGIDDNGPAGKHDTVDGDAVSKKVRQATKQGKSKDKSKGLHSKNTHDALPRARRSTGGMTKRPTPPKGLSSSASFATLPSQRLLGANAGQYTGLATPPTPSRRTKSVRFSRSQTPLGSPTVLSPISAAWMGGTSPGELALPPRKPVSVRPSLTVEPELADEEDDSYVLVTLKEGEWLFEAASEAECMYIVKSGSFQLLGRTEEQPAVVGAGCVLGALSFFGGTCRGESAVAAEPCEVWALDELALNTLLQNDPTVVVALSRAVGRQFAPICQQMFELGLQVSSLRARDTLVKQGSSASGMYLVLSGRIRAFADVKEGNGLNDRIKPIFESARGDTLGEDMVLSSLTHGPDGFARSARSNRKWAFTAVSVRDSEVVWVSYESFIKVFNEAPGILLSFSQALSKRLAKVTNKQRSDADVRNIATIALLPLRPSPSTTTSGTGAPLSVARFAEDLANGLSEIGPTLYLSSDNLDSYLPGTSQHLHSQVNRSQVAMWLARQEEDMRFILLQADSLTEGVTEWSRLCVGQADRVLLVGTAGHTTEVSQEELELVWYGERDQCVDEDEDEDLIHPDELSFLQTHAALGHWTELAVLQPSRSVQSLPVNTRFWYRGRSGLRSHYHVSPDPADMQRLVRFLANQAVGLVLGGGGAKGCAHLGVIQALEEASIPMDCVVGASQGAFMAALYAKHLSSKEMEAPLRQFCSIFSKYNIITGLTFPILSYFSGHTFSNGIRRALQGKEKNEVRIEDLWIKFRCVTTNITRMDRTVHHWGSLWLFTRASMSILGVFPPIISRGEILIDGGYVDNLPIDVARRHCATVLAVDVEDKDTSFMQDVWNYGQGCSGWWVLLMKITGLREVPDFGTLTVWLTCLNNARKLKASVAAGSLIDMYLTPPVTQFHIADYLELDEIMDKGYRYTKERLQQWNPVVFCSRAGESPRSSVGGPLGLAAKRPSMAMLHKLIDDVSDSEVAW